jgi:hydroxyacyl-ACP dehydratase HTD2-like protein with hotdog domain
MRFAAGVDAAGTWVGRREDYPPYDVTRVDVARFAHSIGARAPKHFDPAVARALGYADVVAPLGYYTVIRHTMSNLVPLTELTRDGMAPDLTPPTSYRRRIAAESRVWFHRRLVAGVQVRMTKTIRAVEDKQGRSGAFTAVTYRLDFLVDDALAVVEDFVRVLR